MRVNKPQLLSATVLGNTGSAFTYDRLVGILQYLAGMALLAGEFIAMAAVVYYGFRMVISKGEPAQFNEAKSGLIKAAIGAALIFGVYSVILTARYAAQSLTN